MNLSPTQVSERAVLGLLMSGADITDVPCTGADFDSPAHELVFNAIARVAEAGETPDFARVRFAIGLDQERLYGGALYLHELVERAPFEGGSLSWHAGKVCEFAALRRVRNLGLSLTQVADDGPSATELLATARQLLDATDLGADRDSSTTSISTAVDRVIAESETGERRGHPSPWEDLDRFTRGWYPGRLYVIGARPGIGKSLLAGNAAVHTAKDGHGVFVASMEMSEVEWTQRCLAAEGKINIGRLESGQMEDYEVARFVQASATIGNLPIVINDRDTQTVAGIRASARKATRQVGKLGMIVVDYLQLLEPSDLKRDRHEQVADMSRSLKRLAREFDVPVLALAQVNRASTQRAGGWPTMADLRESGAIEADADQVILMHVEDPETAPHLVGVRVDKGRATAKGTCTLQMEGHYSRLSPVDQRYP